MPNYQNTGAVVANSWVLGSAKCEVAATVSGSAGDYTNIGLIRELSIEEIIEKTSIQADNGPDFAKGIGRHQARVSFNMIEFYPPTWDTLRGGIDSQSSGSAGDALYIATAYQAISTGGLEEITAKAYKFTNNRMISGATSETVFILYSVTLDAGFTFSYQSDNSDDPVMPVPFSGIADLVATRTQGDQLFYIETTIGA